MKHKLTSLIPILYELTCDKCGGTIKFKRSYETKTTPLKKPDKWYEYECTECGLIEKIDRSIQLKQIVYINSDTHEVYAKNFDTGIHMVKLKE